MSLTITNPDATTPAVPTVYGRDRIVVVKVAFDSSYPTGGEVITPAEVGLLQIDAIITNGATTVGRICAPVFSSGVWKLKVFSALSTEVADTTNLSADSVHVIILGR